MTIVIFAATLVLVPMLLAEFTDWLPWVATFLIRRAAAQLPVERRARYAEEWAAEFSTLPGGELTKLVFGLRLYIHARTTGAVLREEVTAQREYEVMPNWQYPEWRDIPEWAYKEAVLDPAARVLMLAQQTAEQAISDARREADELLVRALREADDVVSEARQMAAEIVRLAKNDAPE